MGRVAPIHGGNVQRTKGACEFTWMDGIDGMFGRVVGAGFKPAPTRHPSILPILQIRVQTF